MFHILGHSAVREELVSDSHFSYLSFMAFLHQNKMHLSESYWQLAFSVPVSHNWHKYFSPWNKCCGNFVAYVFQHRINSNYVFFDMLNQFCLARVPSFCTRKRDQNRNIWLSSSCGNYIKNWPFVFSCPHLSFLMQKWKLLKIALYDFSKYVYKIELKSRNKEHSPVCWHFLFLVSHNLWLPFTSLPAVILVDSLWMKFLSHQVESNSP